MENRENTREEDTKERMFRRKQGIRSPSEIAAVKMRVLLTSELVQNYQRSTF
jgi:hypothetical protein